VFSRDNYIILLIFFINLVGVVRLFSSGEFLRRATETVAWLYALFVGKAISS
jgi:hypothetical protein